MVAQLDPDRMGYASEALVGVQVDPGQGGPGSERSGGTGRGELGNHHYGAPSTSSPGLRFKSAEALGIFLRTKVGTIPGVRRTETFVNLAVKKRGYGLAI